jgi:hypothetical protein
VCYSSKTFNPFKHHLYDLNTKQILTDYHLVFRKIWFIGLSHIFQDTILFMVSVGDAREIEQTKTLVLLVSTRK